MSILSGASVSQLLALSSVPRGLRTTRILSMRECEVMAHAFRNLPGIQSRDGLQRKRCIPDRSLAPAGNDDSWSSSLAHFREDRLEDAFDRRASRRCALFVDRGGPIFGPQALRLPHVGAAGEFELQSFDALDGFAIGTGNPAALETPVN